MSRIGYAVAVAALLTGPALADDAMVSGYDIAVDESGQIHMPDVDFHAKWPSLGTWSIAGEDGAGGLHVVYTQPGAIEAFRETGTFPDGTVLIKELLGTETKDMTTGHVSYGTTVSGWFVMVKDTQSRFEGNPLWADGWGWAYFDAKDPGTLVTKSYADECKDCHVPAENTDWVYTEGYPTLAPK